LKELLKPNDVIRYSEHFRGAGADLLAAAKQQGIEGVIGKRASSVYEARRSGDWAKYKVFNSDSFVLCGFTKGERDLFGALVLGIYDHGRLTWRQRRHGLRPAKRCRRFTRARPSCHRQMSTGTR